MLRPRIPTPRSGELAYVQGMHDFNPQGTQVVRGDGRASPVRVVGRLPGQFRPLAASGDDRHALGVDGSVIERDEVAALLFNVSDISRSLERIEGLLGGGDDGEEETDEG
jgi:hypothetical protein